MRASSLEQPFLNVIARETKTRECRSWRRRSCGEWDIVATASPHHAECSRCGIDPDPLAYGATPRRVVDDLIRAGRKQIRSAARKEVE